jgi:multicomponent K+:H+ antiporter subunit A
MNFPLLALLPSLPLLGALLLAFLPNQHRAFAAWCAELFTLAALALVIAMAPAVFAGEVLRWSVEWVPALGLSFGFRMDGLAWMFALLICGIGALVVLYAAYYLDRTDPAARFFQFLLAFMGAMLGVVLSENLLLLVVFWEATSLASFLLIGYWSDRQDAREGARMALTVTGGGGLALLGGVLIIGHIVGSFQLDAVLAAGDVIRAHPLYVPALVLVLLGAFTKSAQFPFHFWLPHAMAAPTPVSAYLHSATMVKLGVFLLARLYPALGHSDPWFWLVSLTGLATLLIGATLAIFRHDLKSLLAYSTISQLGLITLLFGLDEPLAVVAAAFHILNHATFKASLFMAAGIIDHETGTRDMRKLNGLWKYMPWTGALAMVASAAMAGVPLVNGFLSKEMFFGAAVATQSHVAMEWLLPIAATIAGVLGVAYSTRFIHDVFFNGEPVGLTKTPHEPPRFMRIPVEILVVICMAVGVMPALTIGPLLAVGAQATLGATLPDYSLALWHGFNAPLVMSMIALAGGTLLYFGLQRFINLHRIVHVPRGGREAFAWMLERVLHGARDLTLALQNGSLQSYLFYLIVLALLAGSVLLRGSSTIAGLTLGQPSWPGTALGAIGLAAVVAVVVTIIIAAVVAHRQRVLALVLVGAVGLVVSLTFVALSAPDLALTQLLVELAAVILMLLALKWLPASSPPERSKLRRLVHGVVAASAGLGVAVLVLAVLGRPLNSISTHSITTYPISAYYLETAVSLGGGANVVNVILVDFRGFDTLGEITVLAMAALIVATVTGQVRVTPPASVTMAASKVPGRSLMLEVMSRLLLPFAVVVAIYMFLRGHNAPGGGFIAGLVLAIALALQFIGNGMAWTLQRMPIDFRTWIGAGLLIAAATGIGSGLLSHPFLTSSYDYPVLPLIGAVPLASAAAFDLGVFLAVVGATMLMLISLGRIGDRELGR